MKLPELEVNIEAILHTFRVSFNKISLVKQVSSQFVVNDFGLVVCCVNRVDYVEASCAVDTKYKGWRAVYVSTGDNLDKIRYKLLWALMRCGYMKWLRATYPRQIRQILNGTDNLGTLIIEERLRVWADQPKFKFLIDDNKFVLRNGILRELATDPSFFDYMPEEVTC